LTEADRPLPAGRVGRPHGLDGSFYVEEPAHGLPEGTEVLIGERRATIARRAGSDARPLIRVEGVDDRDAAQALRGQSLLVPGGREELGPEEWYDDDLIGCRVEGLGEVRAVLHGPSCDVLEVGDERVLVPLVRDAVLTVDLERRAIEVDLAFLDLEGQEHDA
jgi:16S rRNA processing protein RimM